MWTSDAEGRRAPGSLERRRPRVARRGEEKTMEGRYTGLLVLFFSAVMLLPPLRSLFALGGRYEVREITPHVFVWIPEDIRDQDGDPEFSRAGTAGFIIAPEGVVVVDTTNNPIHARELLYEIRRRTDAPVKYVIDTDPEFDHTLGNEVFWDQEASIISTPAVLSELRRYQKELPARLEGDWKLQARMRGIHPTLPSQTFDSELTLHLAGIEMKLLSFADRDLPANTAVYLPQAKVLFLGDLFENGFFPRVGSRNVGRWIEILRQFESWEVETYVPGHGAPGGKKELAEFRKFLEWLTSEVEASIHQGKSLDQVKTALRPLENYRWRAPELAPSAVEAVFSQLAGAQGAAPAPAKPANQ
jgi:glyoxylase-like metal-dependent hydrolase (beta-lactamase superfamily II)